MKKSQKKPSKQSALFSRVPLTRHGGERLVYQGPNKLNLLRIKNIYSHSLIRSTQKWTE